MSNDYYKILRVSKSDLKSLKKNLISELELVKEKNGKINQTENKKLQNIIVGFYILNNPKYKNLYDPILISGKANPAFSTVEYELNKKAHTVIENLKDKYSQSESGIGDVIAFVLEVTSNIIK